MSKKISLKDVAQHVGVSTALVSYVLNDKAKEAGVGPLMVKKVQEALIELNYQPNLIAKSLKSGKTNVIGIIVADISNPFFSSIARNIEDEARKHGYAVFFGSSDESAEEARRLIDVFLNYQVDAIIIAPAENFEEEIKALQKKVPVVLIDRYFPSVESDCVHIDNFSASYNAVRHLINNGRKRIAMFAYNNSFRHMEERREGYQAAITENNISYNPDWLKFASYKTTSTDVSTQLQKLLFPVLQIDAIFFATNSLAVEGLKIINGSDIKVPEDLAIISFDESDAFIFFYAPISCVSQSPMAIGQAAIQLAVNRIKDGNKQFDTVIVKEKLIIRKSSGDFLNTHNR
jgi:LacI family transcriptional regulator